MKPAATALLPAGMSDLLPPEARIEADILETAMGVFHSRGYDRVKLPLIEFETSLLSGLGTDMGQQTFRLMDPVSQRMMGVRADMTPQVARIAATRLTSSPRPLRLSYAGQVLRVKGTQLRPEREFAQTGVELFGSNAPSADAEVILLAYETLISIGIKNVSIDLCLPTLVPAVVKDLNLSGDIIDHLRQAFDRKDAATITQLSEHIGTQASDLFAAMLSATGPVIKTLETLQKLPFGSHASVELQILTTVIKHITAINDQLPLTLDVVENRGFEYHSGVTFTIFARDARGELGRGGRYIVNGLSDNGEPSTGFTLFMDTIVRASPPTMGSKKLYIPFGTPAIDVKNFQQQGWVTISALEPSSDLVGEAKRLECTHLLELGALRAL